MMIRIASGLIEVAAMIKFVRWRAVGYRLNWRFVQNAVS
jgi:hypothetical protein